MRVVLTQDTLDAIDIVTYNDYNKPVWVDLLFSDYTLQEVEFEGHEVEYLKDRIHTYLKSLNNIPEAQEIVWPLRGQLIRR